MLRKGEELLASSSNVTSSPLPSVLLACSQPGNELGTQCLTLRSWCFYLSPPSGNPSPGPFVLDSGGRQAQHRHTDSWRQGKWPSLPTPGTGRAPSPPLRLDRERAIVLRPRSLELLSEWLGCAVITLRPAADHPAQAALLCSRPQAPSCPQSSACKHTGQRRTAQDSFGLAG